MIVQTYLDEKTFRRFTVFDILSRRRYWKSPVIFATILSVCAIVCFLMHRVDGAILLGFVLLAVGLGMPVVYFITFFSSLKRITKGQDLNPPRLVYTLDISDGDSFSVRNDKEEARYDWRKTYAAYRDNDCVYLFITQDKAFLLPESCAAEGFDALWSLIREKVGKDKCKAIRN